MRMNEEDGKGYDHLQVLAGTFHVLVFAAPFDTVTVRYFERGQPFFCFLYVCPGVTSRVVDVNISSEHARFTFYLGGTLDHADVCQLLKWDMGRFPGPSR